MLNEIKYLQYLVAPMGFDLIIPTNLLEINTTVMQITSFDLLPSPEIYSSIYEFSDTEAAHEGLANLGLESLNFLLNGGTLFLTLQAWAILATVSTLLTLVAKRHCAPKGRSYRFSFWLDKKLKWNLFYEMFLASQIELFASVLIQLKHWDWGAKSGDKAAIVFACVTLGYFLVSTLFMLRIIRIAKAKSLLKNKGY